MKAAAVVALAASLLTTSTEALSITKRDSPRVVGIPIHRRDTSKIVVSSALRKRSATVGQTLDNFEDGSLYFANSTIGTPAQNFRFHIDTGSSDLWANTAGSQICQQTQSGQTQANGDIPCSVSGTYDANKSSTYNYVNSDFSIKYADGTGASGDYVTDTLTIGGATIKSQQFGVGYKSTSSEGVMGIGYPALEAYVQDSQGSGGFNGPAPYANIPQAMVQQGLIKSQAYSLWLDQVDSATGSILFGGVDTAKYTGSLVTLDIVQEGGADVEMIVTLDGVSISTSGQNKTALSSSIPVLLDSGSTLSYLPTAATNIIFPAVGAKYDAQDQVAFCPCSLANSSDALTFSFAKGAKTISVDMSDMVLQGGISQDFDCTFGIVPQSSQSGSSGSSFTLGDSFIRNAYVVYDMDNNQISLAQTHRFATGSNVMEIQNGTAGVPDATGSAAPASATVGGGTNAVQGGGSASSSSGVMPTAAPNMAAAAVAGAGLLFAAL
ncbi:MAG: hypothetical protein LQ340_002583 [Diploschistes diacapsis]|nr:MAG: hypothetical protein LQ340_002583 [Diploschistes diacapsis]